MTENGRAQTPSTRSTSDYIPGIEGLRGISVLAVLLYHLDERLLPGGFVGVDIFFVISGFVVALATSGLQAQTFWGLAATFYRRRFVRILPAALAFIVIVQVLAVLFIPTINRLVDGDRTAAAAAFGASNFVLWWWSADYFSPGPELNPFTHTWSLALEEQFYLTFPLFVWLIWRAGGRWRKWGLALLAATVLASLVAAAVLTPRWPTLSFYLLPTRFWELGAGVLLFAAIGRGRALGKRTLQVLQIVGTVALIAALLLTDPARMPFPDGIMSVLAGTALIAVSCCGESTPLARGLGQGWLRYFGRISYSLYLWHWGVLVLMRWTVGLDGPLLKLAAVFASIALAHASWRYVERPVRTGSWTARRSNREIILCGLLAMVLAAGGVIATVAGRSSLTLSVTGGRDVWLAYKQQQRGSCGVVRQDESPPNAGHLSIYSPDGCPQPKDPRRLFVIGDSHAMVYQRMFGTVALDAGISAHVYAESGCAVFPGIRKMPEQERVCDLFMNSAIAEVVKQARKGDWLFLPGLRSARQCTPVTKPCIPAVNHPYDAAELAAEAARMTPLLDRGVRVIFEAPKPGFSFHTMRCSDWFNRSNPACKAPLPTLAQAQAHRAHAMGLFARLRTIEPRIELWDSFPLLCNTPVCSPWRDGKPLFTDTDHVSGYGNDVLTEPFEKVLGVGR